MADIVLLPRRYRRLPPDAFACRSRRVDIVPDDDGGTAFEQTSDSGGVLISGAPKAVAALAGLAFALRHNASLTLHMATLLATSPAPPTPLPTSTVPRPVAHIDEGRA